MPAKSKPARQAPTHENRTVGLRYIADGVADRLSRPPNKTLRSREYCTPTEIDKLIAAAKDNRWGQRDATLILVIYRHGLRASEAANLEWSQIDFTSATLHVQRLKNGKPSAHPIRGDELRMLRQLHRDQEPKSPFVFVTERGTPFAPEGINRLVARLGEKAKLGLPIHAHMLRHSCGYALANAGHDTRAIQDYLGHVSIEHTTRYTELAPTRFKDFWK